jgi:hypothetical protein
MQSDSDIRVWKRFILRSWDAGVLVAAHSDEACVSSVYRDSSSLSSSSQGLAPMIGGVDTGTGSDRRNLEMISGQSRDADFLSGDIWSSDQGSTRCSAFAVLTGWASSPETVRISTGQATFLYSPTSLTGSGKSDRQAPLSTEQNASEVIPAFSHLAALPEKLRSAYISFQCNSTSITSD